MTYQKTTSGTSNVDAAIVVKPSFTALQRRQSPSFPKHEESYQQRYRLVCFFFSSPRIAALRALARSTVLLRDHTSS